MARSPHAYVRGNTLKFYEWLDSLAPNSLPEGPPIWICGDCHSGNLGPVADAEGRVDLQIRDFDQTVIGNPAHDLIRLGLSLSTAARGSNVPGVTIARIIENLVEGYCEEFDARRPPLTDEPRFVSKALKLAESRSWRQLAKERVDGRTARLPLGKRFWPLSGAERKAVDAFFGPDELLRLGTALSRRLDSASVTLIDASYWFKGCSSLGLLRFAVLLDVGGDAVKGRDLCLIDVKEATKPLAPHYQGVRMPRDNAERVVQGARSLSPNLGERMVAGRLMGRPVFVRELLPEDLKLELDCAKAKETVNAARYLAGVVGRAHARQLDAANRRAWRNEVRQRFGKKLDAPTWLWSSIVDLIGTHERSYLEHCRTYALGQAV